MTTDLEHLLAVVDRCNAEDPTEVEVRGERGPKELLHGRLVDEWVQRLDPRAGPAQRLAARAHHLRRWTRPRSEYPEGRAGYLRWRTAARHAQAAEVRSLLIDAGAEVALADRVEQIVDKVGLGSDPEVQTHEDALCLVFLESQLDEVAESLAPDHLIDVLAKTLGKMSSAAVAAAIELPLSANGAVALSAATELSRRARTQASTRAGSSRPE